MVHDPKRADFVRQAFELFATGLHRKPDVLRKVNALGLRTLKGKQLTNQTLNSILKNQLYMGRMVVKDWNVDVQGDFCPIVEETTFEKVQTLLSHNGRTVTPKLRNNPAFPLRQFVRCAACGTSLTGSNSRGRSEIYPYYFCRTKGCRGVSIRAEVLHDSFLALLDGLKPRPEYVSLFRAIVADVWEERLAQAAQHRKTLEKRQESLLERKDELILAHVTKGLISEEEFIRLRDKADEELALVRIELFDVSMEELDVEGVLAFAQEMLLDASKLWRQYTIDQKQRFQHLIFPEGLSFGEGKFRTAPTCSIFTYLRKIGAADVNLASPMDLSWNQVEGWLKELVLLQNGVAA